MFSGQLWSGDGDDEIGSENAFGWLNDELLEKCGFGSLIELGNDFDLWLALELARHHRLEQDDVDDLLLGNGMIAPENYRFKKSRKCL